ncbi:POZ domain-containing protein [Rhizophagus irregularis]|uniref:POZ domain-containing protein n=1 Tax=Rhizophagus irregularis TaxID=588596 RepID=A0A2N0RIH9_9GLOM|nr:POZ domain-containing protein [Rhizophagus irregularis]
MTEETIILNVGGVKYETFRSTLTAYPNTMLGTMFSERNKMTLKSDDNKTYFIDRNGYAFYYIMEFYRTGKILWPGEIKNQENMMKLVTIQQLEIEIEYFQIPFDDTFLFLVHKSAANVIDKIILSLIQMIKIHLENFGDVISMLIKESSIEFSQDQNQPKLELLIPASQSALLHKFLKHNDKSIGNYLESKFSHINLVWSCTTYTIFKNSFAFLVRISFELNFNRILDYSIIRN